MPAKAFKPPRPSNSAKKTKNPIVARKSTSISKPRSTATKPKEKGRSSGSKSLKNPDLPSLSPLSEDEDDPFASPSPAPSVEAVEIDSEQQEERNQSIPPELLTRLLHENFKEEGTRLSRDASAAVGRYMETFVREALARAAFARVESDERNGATGMGAGEGFLEVEDLEKLAPQLLLDF